MSNPILREFPYSFETERLTIRGPLPGDGKRVLQAAQESEAELRPWMPWAVELPDEAGYEALVREGRLKFLAREDLWMMLLLKDSETLIGCSGLHRINWAVPKFEIGYWVRTSCSRKGYITEAVKGISSFAFKTLGARRVEIRCDSLNMRSAAVAERAGFELEATLRNHDRNHFTDALRHTLIFAKFQA